MLEKTLFDLCNTVGDALVRMFSLDLCGDEFVLADAWRGGETTALGRIFRYFSDGQLPAGFSKEQYEAIMGSSPHTDWGLITLIVADDTPGLQLFWDGQQVGASRDAEAGVLKDSTGNFVNSDAGWYTVRPEFDQGKIFVNTGDFMAIASAGRYISPLHRVLSPEVRKRNSEGDVKAVERKSCVFFYYPNYNAQIPKLADGCQQTYSVFTDQAKDNGALEVDENVSFGKFITKKWASVMRGS
jgi:isopenicillin N synthase-like dioxygenase